MRLTKRVSSATMAGALVAGLLVVQAVSSPPASANYDKPTDCRPSATAGAPTEAPPPPVTGFTPTTGTVGFNNPLGTRAAKRVNTQQILNAINSVPTCGKIQLATWNFRSPETASALMAAIQRGVTVQVVMSSFNDTPKGTEYYNPTWKRFKEYVDASNLESTPEARNRRAADDALNKATICTRSCRYGGGAAHSKFYLFSSVGSAKNVVMYGSHNLTDVAAYNQWNDLYTVANDARYYTFMQKVFVESQPKQNQSSPYRRGTFDGNTLTMNVYPYVGNGRPSSTDPILQILNRVKCTGAGSLGVKGRTALRINVAAILYSRGQTLTNKLVQLKRQGCNIKVLVTNIGFHSLKALQRNGVPVRQLTRYDDRNKRFTFFTHTKFIAVNGNYGGRANQQVVWNGSANWTNSALVSDELFGEVRRANVVRAYNRHVNTWFAKTPMGRRIVPTTSDTGARRANDPWAGVERDF